MSFATELVKSSSALRTLIEIDIASPNVQWVNIGAGIWYVSATDTYTYVDESFWGNAGFSVQNFGAIGSVRVDGAPLDKQAALSDLTNTPNTFYYDSANRDLYVCLENFDEPALHVVNIGVIYGYSTMGFAPIGGPGVYEGRVTRLPQITVSRDPLFYGRLVFNAGSVGLYNGDGEFDTFGRDNDIYGNEARVKIGFEDVDYADYDTVFTGYIETFQVSETEATFTIADKRKQLTKPITYSTTATNALDTIADILSQAYGITYDSRYYDTAAWEIARALVADVTIDMQEPAPVIDVIEDIAASVFGLFQVNADGKFTFKVVDTTGSIDAFIPAMDVITPHNISYDPTEVVSSVRVGYARDWATTGTQYTYYTDTSREASAFTVYKTYNQRTFDTLLVTLTAATNFATTVLDYLDTVRGVEAVTVPMEHYTRSVGDTVGIEVQRGLQPMLGELKAEITGATYVFETPTVTLNLRYLYTVESVITDEDGAILLAESDELVMVEA